MPRKKGKRRKRTNKNIPAKGVLRRHADRLWSLAVRDDWEWKCAVCRHRVVEAHHLIPRQHEALRYITRNGIGLCSSCHKFDPGVSPHLNAAGWMYWLREHQPNLHTWYTETVVGSYKSFDGTTNAAYFIGVIRDLKQYVTDEDCERILGVKFAKWLTENT